VNRLCLFLILRISCFAQAPLLPSAFPELSRSIRTDLQRRHCKIPQLTYLPGFQKRENVISGHFSNHGQTDWAVLCEVGGTSTILIYWNASEINPTELAQQKAEVPFAYTADNHLENIRIISTAGKRHIMTSYQRFGGTKPPLIDHDGIEDGLDGKSSSINYLYRAKWIGWTSSD
jgi:hypothetical protein